MTFPFTFPHTFGENQSSTGSGLPITGWWPDINVKFVLSVPPSLHPSGFTRLGMDVSVPPSLAFTANVRQLGAFALSVPPSLGDTATPVEAGALNLSAPPSLAFSAATVQPAGFALSVPPSLTPAGVPVEPGAFGLSVPPLLAFTAQGNAGPKPTSIQVVVQRAATR